MENNVITYENDEYVGKLYGKSSMIIKHKSGSPSLHTGSRSINTYEELKEQVDGFPEFLKILENADYEDDDEDDI